MVVIVIVVAVVSGFVVGGSKVDGGSGVAVSDGSAEPDRIQRQYEIFSKRQYRDSSVFL